MSLLRINIFGKATFFSCGDLFKEEWQRLAKAAQQENLSPEYAFFTPDFFAQNQFLTSNGKKINEWKSVNDFYQGLLFHADYRSTFEIKMNGRRLRKFPLAQLLPENSLFPLFEWKENEIDLRLNQGENTKRILLSEERTGLTGHFRYTIPYFEVTKLKLERTTLITKNNSRQYISGIFYEGKKLVPQIDDSVVTGWKCENV